MRQRWMNRKRGMGMLKGSGWALVMLMMLSVWKMAASSEEEECENRWIHIRKLPSRFNLDLLANCSEYPMLDDLCPYLGNHGLGQKTHNRSRSWYRTDPSMLELVFHRRMLEYPCLTQDPLRANAIYLPYYAGLDAIRYLYGPESNFSALHGLHLFHFLQQDNPQIWARHMAHDHFLVMARPAWDFSQPLSNDPPIWGTSFLELPQFFNLTALTLEARAWPWQEHAVPYPTSFHPLNLGLLESWITRGRRSKRSILALFAGGGGGSSSPNIRRSIRSECENATSDPSYEKLCEIVDCSNGVCEHDPIRFMRPMLQASFCLQPPGDTPTRRSTFDAILAGCIPVFFEDLSAKSQYGWHLPENEFEDFSVFIPKEEVVFRGLRILNVLQRIPRAKVRSLRQRVLALIPNVLYRKHDSSPGLKAKKDAFDLAIDGTLDKIRSRIAFRAWQSLPFFSRPWVEYKGTVPQNELQSKQRDLELEANALVSLGERISVDILPYDEAAKICGGSLPDYISKVSQNRSKKRLTKVSYKVES